MDVTKLIQYLSYILMGVGVLAFFVSIVVQAVKEMPGLSRIHANAVALAVSLILCPAAVVIACQYFKVPLTWYYIFASLVAAFVVYLVSTGGWKRVYGVWERTRYKRKEEKEEQ